MRTLDRYIIRGFLANYVLLLGVLLSLFMVIDLVLDLDEFLKAGREIAARQSISRVAATFKVILDYYGPSMLLAYVYLSGLTCVGAMGFTLARLNRYRELTAMTSGGISLYRVALPILIVGGLLNAAALPIQEFVVPKFAHKLARSKSHVAQESVKSFPLVFVPDDAGHLLSAREFSGHKRQMKNVTILKRDARGRTLLRVWASQADWDASADRWVLTDGKAIWPQGQAPPDADPGVSRHFATDLTPDRLLARRAWSFPRLLSVADLHKLAAAAAAEPEEAQVFQQIIQSRFSLVIVNVLVLAMGLPFFLQAVPLNMVKQAVFAAGVCVGAWGTGLVLLQMPAGNLGPSLSAWMPVAIYLPLTAGLLQSVKT